MYLFLSCFPNKPRPMTAQAALGVKYFLCHSYSESLYATMATVMGQWWREAEMTGTSALKSPSNAARGWHIKHFPGNYGDSWNKEDDLNVNTRLKRIEKKGIGWSHHCQTLRLLIILWLLFIRMGLYVYYLKAPCLAKNCLPTFMLTVLSSLESLLNSSGAEGDSVPPI